MSQETYAVCAVCSQSFWHERGGPHAHAKKYCPKHEKAEKARLNRERVARCRAKKKAPPAPAKKQDRRKAARPVSVGEPVTKKVTASPPEERGLYASEKQPARRSKRAKVGLPSES
jgi:hypothetical protein